MKNVVPLQAVLCIAFIFPLIGGMRGAAQPTFQKTWGGSLNDRANDIISSIDSNFVIVGSTYNSSLGCDNILLMKINTIGDTLWTRVYGRSGGQRGISVLQDSDGGYLISAIGSGAIGNSGNDIILLKTDSDGNQLWSKVYGGTYHEDPVRVIPVQNQGYLLAGNTESFGYINPAECDTSMGLSCANVYLIRINNQGDTVWTRVISDTVGGGNRLSSIEPLKDGNFLITGLNASFSGLGAGFLIKIDTAGVLKWSKAYLPYLTDARGVIERDDGRLLIMGNGYRIYPNFFTAGIILAETDSVGNSKWIKILNKGVDSTNIGPGINIAFNNQYNIFALDGSSVPSVEINNKTYWGGGGLSL